MPWVNEKMFNAQPYHAVRTYKKWENETTASEVLGAIKFVGLVGCGYVVGSTLGIGIIPGMIITGGVYIVVKAAIETIIEN